MSIENIWVDETGETIEVVLAEWNGQTSRGTLADGTQVTVLQGDGELVLSSQDVARYVARAKEL